MTYPGPEAGAWGKLSADLSTAFQEAGIELRTFPESQLGGPNWALEAVRNNLIDMAFVGGYRLAREVRAFHVLNFPMLATNLSEARSIIGAVGPELAERAEDKGLSVLAYTWLAGTFVTAGDCVLTPKDISDAKVIDGPEFHQKFIEYLGGTSVALAFSEVYAAMQTGLTNTGLFSIPLIVGSDLRQATDCITDPSEAAIMLIPVVLVMNLDRYETIAATEPGFLKSQVERLETTADALTLAMVASAVRGFRDEGKSSAKIEGDALADWRNQADEFNRSLAADNDVSALYEEALQARSAGK